MAKKLSRKYPWKKWFDRGKFRLVKDDDYSCKTHGMASQIRNEAVRRRVSVSIRIDYDGTIDVRVNGRKPIKRHTSRVRGGRNA